MIYTVTLNPSLDLVMNLNEPLTAGGSFKVASESYRAGGRGLNVSAMLKNLGENSIALGFVAGFTGDELMRLFANYGIQTGFVRVRSGKTRINIRLNAKEQTKINGLGPQVTMDDVNYLVKKLSNLNDNDFLVLAGDIQPSLPVDIYQYFFEQLKNINIKAIFDSNLNLTMPILKYKPFVVKTNYAQIISYTQEYSLSISDIYNFAIDLCNKGAQNVVIALNDYSIIFINKEMAFKVICPNVQFIDPIGAEDSMIAGFIHSYTHSNDIRSACKFATACGMASASELGLASHEHANSFIDRIKIEDLDLNNL